MATKSLIAPVKRVAAAHELLWNMTLRELRTKYRKSVLGWTWSMLNPLATVAIYSFVFGHLFGADAPIGVHSGVRTFALYLLCALLACYCCWCWFACKGMLDSSELSLPRCFFISFLVINVAP